MTKRGLPALLALLLCATGAAAYASRAAASSGASDASSGVTNRGGGDLSASTRGFDAARSGQTQNPAQPEPAPTPYVRRRTVTPRPDAQTPKTDTGQTAAPQESQPAVAAPQSPTPAAVQPVPQAARPEATPAPQSGDASAQDSEEVDENDVVRVESNLVIIPASVVDSRGRAITDLKVEDFELKVDGEVKPIGDLSRAETPVNVALLFDNSASLSKAREFEKQAAVRFFQSVVRPIDRAAIYSISSTPTLSQGLTNEVPRLVRTIERFGKPEGATALFDAVAQAADYMRPVPGRKVLVLVSDGTDTMSDASFEDAVNRALRAECQVYVVQTRQVEDPSLHDPVSEQRMYRITEQTGGAVYIPHTVEELDAVFTQISLDLSQQYLLSYYPQDERRDKFFRFINVRVKTRPYLRVRARKGFYPPSAAQSAANAPGGRAQFTGGLTNGTPQPEYVTAAQTVQPNDNAAPPRRAANPSRPAADAPRAVVPVRARPGPEGPDTEEATKTASDMGQPTPTFTLTVAQPAASKSETSPARAETQPAPAETNPARLETTPAAPAPSPAPTPSSSLFSNEPQLALTSAAPPGTPKDDAPRANAEKHGAPVSGGVLNGKATYLPRPSYPSAAKTAGAQGKVVVEVTIDENGKVIEARAIAGHPFLQPAAVQAARQARFSPATLSGTPVRIKGTINYVFALP